MAQLWSSLACAIAWASATLECHAGTQPPADSPDVFVVCERVGGQLAFPHDDPQIAFQVWAKSEADAEDGAMALAIAAQTAPPDDRHVNAAGVPDVYSYGMQDGGWHVWQTTIPFNCNII